MKKCKLRKMTHKQCMFLMQLIRNTDFKKVALAAGRMYGEYTYIMLVSTPIEKLIERLSRGQQSITIDMSTAAALYTIFNSMDIEDYDYILPIVQDIEHYITHIVYTSQRNTSCV